MLFGRQFNVFWTIWRQMDIEITLLSSGIRRKELKVRFFLGDAKIVWRNFSNENFDWNNNIFKVSKVLKTFEIRKIRSLNKSHILTKIQVRDQTSLKNIIRKIVQNIFCLRKNKNIKKIKNRIWGMKKYGLTCSKGSRVVCFLV